MRGVGLRIALCLLWAMGAAGHAAAADHFPSHYIKIVVGPGLDIPARLFGQKMGEILGQPFIIDQKSGAGGAIAVQSVAAAPPDGYTLLLATAAYTINTATGRFKLDLRQDLVPVGQLTDVKYVLVVHPSIPVKTLAELIAYAKAHPGQLNYGSTGIGTPPHLAGEMLKYQAGIDIVHVPFREPTSAITAMIAGNIQMMFALAATAQPQIKSGALTGIAISSRDPSPFVPGILPVDKLGLPNFDVLGWNGLVAPKGTPPEVVKKLNDAINQGLKDDKLRETTLKSGYEPTHPNTPAEFGKFIADDTQKWIDLSQKIGLHLNP